MMVSVTLAGNSERKGDKRGGKKKKKKKACE